MLRDLNIRHNGVRRMDPCAIVRQLRNLNQGMGAGARELGLSTNGMLGGDLPRTGDNGPSWMYPSLDLPADFDKEYRLWIKSTSLPLGILPTDDYGSEIAGGLADGSYPTTFTLYEQGVPLGPDVVNTIQIGVVAPPPTTPPTPSPAPAPTVFSGSGGMLRQHISDRDPQEQRALEIKAEDGALVQMIRNLYEAGMFRRMQ